MAFHIHVIYNIYGNTVVAGCVITTQLQLSNTIDRTLDVTAWNLQWDIVKDGKDSTRARIHSMETS